MHIWTDLATREGVFLLTLLALGAGPSAFLSDRLDSVSRLVLAPALGLCVGVGVTLTLVQWEPVHSTYWVIIPCALASVGVAVWRVRAGATSFALPLRELGQITLIAIAVLGPASSTLHAQHTVGPVALNVYDAVGYVSEIDGQQTHAVSTARTLHYPFRNLTQAYWDVYALGYQNLDVSALEGSVNDIIGLGATDTESPFLIALVLVGALGAYAAFRYVTASRSWAAVLAGALFGGAFFMQLWADSSEAAISGLALVLPFIVIGAEALRGRLADTVLLGLTAAGLLSVYPLFAPAMAGSGAIVLLIWAARALRRRRPTRGEVIGVLWRVAVVVVLAAALSPVAFSRDVTYWRAVLTGGQSFAGLPAYSLPLDVLPSYLLQTRQLYYLPVLGVGGAHEALFAIVIPLIMLGVIVVGFRWRPQATVLLAFAAVSALLAEYVWVKNSCEYCVQRNVLPIAPMATVVLALGVAAVCARRGRAWVWLGAVLAVLIAGVVGERMRVTRRLVLDTAYMMESANRSVLAHLPRRDVPVLIEGYGTDVRAPGEMPLILALVNERTGGRATIALHSADYSVNAYIGPADQPAALDSGYRFVLTRLAGIQTGRRVIARSAGIALEERVSPLDVTPVAGVGDPLARFDPSGSAYVQGAALKEPLELFVTGGRTSVPVYARIGIETSEPISVPRQTGVTSTHHGDRLTVCARATGRAPVRLATLALTFTPTGPPNTAGLFGLPQPANGVRLASMSAVSGQCRP